MSTAEEKLDALLAGFDGVKEKLGKLEADLAATKESQEESTERALKRIRRDRPLQFQRKGHEEQFRFNLDVQDHVAAAANHLGKLAPSEKDKPIIERALKELEEGSSTLAERQKHIRLADQSENGWDAVAEYIGHSFADDEADDSRMEKSDRSAGIKKRRKAAAARKSKRPYGQPQFGYRQDYYEGMGYRWDYYDDTGYQGPQGYGRQDRFYRPAQERQPPYRRPRGPCYQCGKMGHIRAECSRQPDKYPFCNGVSGSGEYNDHVCASNYGVDNVCAESKDHSKVASHSTGVVNTIATQGMSAFCNGGVSGTSEQNDPADIDNDPIKGVNTVCVKSKGQSEVNNKSEGVFNTSSEDDSDVIDACTKYNEPNKLSDSIRDPLVHEIAEWDPSLDRCWEVEEGMEQIEDVQGRLKVHLPFWEQKLKPVPWILSCIRDGYKLPLRSVPSRFCKPNQQSAIENPQFVTKALLELERNRCIKEVSQQPNVCSPLSVVDNGRGKLGPVINLRYLNQFLWQDKFKYEDLV